MANKNSKTDAEVLAAADANPLLAALRANDKKNLFKTNVTTAFFKTGFQLFDHFFGAVQGHTISWSVTLGLVKLSRWIR